jgi:hypothetical protein
MRASATASCWAPVSGSFHNPEVFGTLTLSRTQDSGREEAGSAGESEVSVRLQIDWKALGLDPRRAKLRAPAIESFHPSAECRPGEPIPIEPGKGALLVVEQ